MSGLVDPIDYDLLLEAATAGMGSRRVIAPMVGAFQTPESRLLAGASEVQQTVKAQVEQQALEALQRVTKGLNRFFLGRQGDSSVKEDLKGSSFSTPKRGDLIDRKLDEATEAISTPEQTKARMHANLGALRAEDPILADRIAFQNEKKLGYVAANLPKKEALGSVADGYSRYQPNDSDKWKAASALAAADDPLRLVDELASGKLTSSTVKAVKEVWPKLHDHIQTQITERLLEQRKPLAYWQRIQLSLLTGKPADSTMRPAFVHALQQNFIPEDDSKAQLPALPAASATPEPTPAQSLSTSK